MNKIRDKNEELNRISGFLGQSKKEIFNSIPEIIFESDKGMNMTYANQRAFELLGIEPKDLIEGIKLKDIIIPDQSDKFISHLNLILEGKNIISHDYLFKKKDGTSFWGALHTYPIHSNNNIVGLRSIIFDITQRKAKENLLKKSEHKFQDLYSSAPIAYFTVSSDGFIKNANTAALEFIGYKIEELKRLKFIDLYEDASREKARYLFKKFKSGKSFDNEELVYKRKDGRDVVGLLSVSPVLDESGEVIESRSIIVDITRQKEVEKALKRSEERYRSLYESNKDGIVYIKLNGKILDANRAYLEMLEYTLDEIKEKKIFQITPPKWHELEKFLFKNQVMVRGYSDEYEKEYIKKDGTIFPIRVRAWLLKDEITDEPIGVWAMVRDITEQKKIEKQFQYELNVNTAIADLSNALISPQLTIEDIAKIVLNYAKILTNSELGYVSSINPVTKENIIHTLIERMEEEDSVQGESSKNSFPRESDGSYLTPWGYTLNLEKAYYINALKKHETSEQAPKEHIIINKFLSVPALINDELVGQIALANSNHDYTIQDLGTINKLAELYAIAVFRNQSEEILKESEEKYRLITERANDFIAIINKNFVFEYINENPYKRILGYTFDDLVGKSPAEFIHPEDLELSITTFNNLLQKGGESLELRFRKNDGNYIWIDARGTIFTDRTGKEKALIISRDISIRKAFEEKIKDYMKDLEDEIKIRTKELIQSEKLASIGLLASGIAHEINNPITGVINYAQIIKDKLEEYENIDLNSRPFSFIDGIIREGERISKIVDTLLLYARKDPGEFNSYDINKIIKSTIDLLLLKFKNYQIEFKLKFDENLPKIPMRHQNIQQVILNILQNSIDALNEKYGQNHKLGQKRIEITTSLIKMNNKNHVKIMIWDNGKGVKSENLNRLFDPFFTTKNYSKEHGTGLGLSVSHRIIDDHHGKIQYESKWTEWTQVQIILPVEQ